LGAAQRTETSGQVGIDPERDPATSARGDRRAGAVGGEVERREVGELGTPEGELGVEDVALEPGALPGPVVGVLDGELWVRGRRAVAEGEVRLDELADEDALRPPVRDDVVQDDDEDVLPGA